MKVIDVSLKGGTYKVNIGTDSYGVLKADLTKRKSHIFLIADKNAYIYHEELILNSLPEKPVGIYLIEGEKEKNINSVIAILEKAANFNLTRSDCMVSFGGGVCGDVTGFCAALYMRGIDYYQVPTTLLSQVDSSVGGKTGINLKAGKNLVGSFKQPTGVYINTKVLNTLPIKELNQGKAEMIKAALINDSELFKKFEESEIVSEENISRCVEIKLEYVKDDEFDTGKRMILNFGHTIAHALEKKIGYGKLPHGEAVSIGMAMSSELSEKHGISEKGTNRRIIQILKNNNLPVNTSYKLSELAEEFKKDKKNSKNMLNNIFLERIGKAVIKKMSIEDFVLMGDK